jgi:hypothetical protein
MKEGDDTWLGEKGSVAKIINLYEILSSYDGIFRSALGLDTIYNDLWLSHLSRWN